MTWVRYEVNDRRLSVNGLCPVVDTSQNTSDPFRFTIDTTKAGGLTKSFALPLIATGSYSMMVDWGDNSRSAITAYNAPSATHTYAADGVYTLKIYGKCWGWRFNNAGDKLRIIDIQQWGKGFRLGTNEGNYFLGCSNLIITATDAPDLSATTSFENAFEGCSSLNADLSGWDVSNITTFRDAFAFCTSFNHPGIASWNLASAETLQSMFYGATTFNQDLGAWDTSNVTNMRTMFNSCSAFNNGGSGSIANWDTSNVTDMYGMFYYASKFNQNIGAWDVSKNTIFSQMFEGASAFNNGGSDTIKNWDTSASTLFYQTFAECPVFNQPLNWDVSNATTLQGMFYGAQAFNQDISKWDVRKVTTFYQMFYGATNFNNGANTDVNPLTGRTGLDGWDVSNVTTMYYMFMNASAFNRPIGNWNVSKVTDMVAMFYVTSFNQDIGNWDVSSCKNIGYMFGITPFNQDIGNWDVSNVEVAQAAFYQTPFNQDLSKWNLGKCRDCYWMFGRAFSFNNGANTRVNPVTGRAGIDGWRIGADLADGSVSFQNFMWSNGSVMAFNRPIANWNMRKAYRCDAMFTNCTSFNQDLSSWDMSQVTNMGYMFSSCSALKQNFGGWNVAACTTFTNMFSGCNLNEVGTTTNYDALLVGWAAQNVQNSKSFHGGSSKYSAVGLGSAAAGTGRAHLNAALNASPTPGHAWTITDGGLVA